ncbi:DUF3329 domain-containing protein [Pelagovum pacificum]|uniref:DUF3329 domain-containing protein n=1 Tax=Pelagovum pacificum TaxID=2588711 RepID=A0A5C5GD34_9RHOB|nr:DUF3329 domain-containing protein [Pelagovum pacificum]QQA41294.1 DUF3329 domain-containing protein [Pelagovum pacificum]TNY31899.1 DUF3329 domain-containing protein [Pelagovum pacificum]
MLDTNDPFYRPLWIRVAIVAVTFCWAVIETIGGNVLFAMLSGAICLYAGWRLFITYDPDAAGRTDTDKPED